MSRPTHVQVARAANFIHTLLQFRRTIDRESLSPVSLATLVLTLCRVCVFARGGVYHFSFLPSQTQSPFSVVHTCLFQISLNHFRAKSRCTWLAVFRDEQYNCLTVLLLLSAFPIRGRHSGFSFTSYFYQLYLPPSLQPQPCPLSPHP